MRSIFVSALAIVAAAFAAPTDSPVNDLVARDTRFYNFSTGIGGLGGQAFSDINDWAKLKAPPNITTFGIWGDERVDQINYEVVLPGGGRKLYTHGGNGGYPVTLSLNDDEVINKLEVQVAYRNSHGDRIDGGKLIAVLLNSGSSVAAGTTVALGGSYLAGDMGLGVDGLIAAGEAGVVIGGLAFIPAAIILTTTTIKHAIHSTHKSLRLYFLRITTSSGRTIERGMQDVGQMWNFTPPAGYSRLVGFQGRSGNEVDAILPIWG